MKFIVSSLTSDHRCTLVFRTVCLIKYEIKLCINHLSLQEITSDIYIIINTALSVWTRIKLPFLPRALSKLEILPARTLRLSSTSTSKQSFISLYGQIMLKLVQRLKKQNRNSVQIIELSSYCDEREFHFSRGQKFNLQPVVD